MLSFERVFPMLHTLSRCWGPVSCIRDDRGYSWMMPSMLKDVWCSCMDFQVHIRLRVGFGDVA